jgi:hypothetical protein
MFTHYRPEHAVRISSITAALGFLSHKNDLLKWFLKWTVVCRNICHVMGGIKDLTFSMAVDVKHMEFWDRSFTIR